MRIAALSLIGLCLGILPSAHGQLTNRLYTIAEMGPHHRVLRAVADARGARARPAASVVELANGMNFWDGQRWVPSDASFQTTPEGFLATNIQHKVRLSADINRVGAVTLVSPDQKITLSSSPIGIGLFEPVSGRFELIAGLTNSTGVLVSSNQVVYQNAFPGLCANLKYTLTRHCFEQDVLFTGGFDPTDWGFSTNCRVQIITEFYGAPEPERVEQPLYVEKDEAVRATMASPDFVDEMLGFGELSIGMGTVYTVRTNAQTVQTGTVVAKEFRTIDQRSFLIESVQYSAIREQLAALPRCHPSTAATGDGGKTRGYASLPRLPATARADTGRRSMTLARRSAADREQCVAIDYRVVLTTQATLQGDSTYLVSGEVDLSSLTIEAGAVVKYVRGMSIRVGSAGNGVVTCKATNYRPAIFTCVDDDSVGETMNGFSNDYTGAVPGTVDEASMYADPALGLYQSASLTNCWFRFARKAISNLGFPALMSISATHSQFFHCVKAISITGNSGSGSGYGAPGTAVIIANNVLVTKVPSPFTVPTSPGVGQCGLNNCTFDQVTTLISGGGGGREITPTSVNCIYANVTGLGLAVSGDHNGFYLVQFPRFGDQQFGNDSDPNPFTIFQGGDYYLNPGGLGNDFRGKGRSDGLPSGLAADLSQRTTARPIDFPVLSANTSLGPQAQRDNFQSSRDLGYHYDPIDYIATYSTIANLRLTLQDGVVLGMSGYGTGDGAYGLDLQDGAEVIGSGSPTLFNRICYAGNIQEQRDGKDEYGNITVPLLNPSIAFLHAFNNAINATVRFRFTDVSMACGLSSADFLSLYAGAGLTGELSFQDSQIRGGQLKVENPASQPDLTFALTNNVFERCKLILTRSTAEANSRIRHYCYNNLFRFGPVAYTYNSASAEQGDYVWDVRNNLFDRCPQTLTGDPLGFFNSKKNAFAQVADGLQTVNPVINLYPSYCNGPLGPYYYPPTPLYGTVRLINAGDGSAAAAGLYHYTTKTNFVTPPTTCASTPTVQEKEGGSIVDIGFHYLAVDENGQPLDSNADAIPDYVADANGDGMFEPGVGEVVWDLAITQPPLDQMVTIGTLDVRFDSAACGVGGLAYQWYHNDALLLLQDYPTATSSSLSIPHAIKNSDVGVYKIKVTDEVSLDEVSASAMLRIEGDQTGTEFWVAFQRAVATIDCGMQMQLLISSLDQGAAVTVTMNGTSSTSNLQPQTTTVVSVPSQLMVDMNVVPAPADVRGIHITSDNAISVVGFYLCGAASEAFRVYPSARLGNSYRVMARHNNYAPGGEYSECTVLATTPGSTTISILPPPVPDLYPQTVTLSQGQAYQMGSAYDATGTHLSSDRPFAVFAGNSRNREPNQSVFAANPEVEQQIPVATWGTHVFTVPFGQRGFTYGDSYRILTSQNNTHVVVNFVMNGQTQSISLPVLQAGETSDSDPWDSFSRPSADWAGIPLNTPLEFVSDAPIQVAHISMGTTWTSPPQDVGDPYITLVPHVGQYTKSCTVWIPPQMAACGSVPYYDWTSQVSIVVPSTAIDSTYVDGTIKPQFSQIGTSGYSYAQYIFPAAPSGAPHTVVSTDPMFVEVYGFGFDDGFGYLGNVGF